MHYPHSTSNNNPGPSGAGAVLLDEGGGLVFRLSLFLGSGTNNFAEYQALIIGASEALERGVRNIEIRMDSMLVVQQVNGSWRVNKPHLKKLQEMARGVLSRFLNWRLTYIPREENTLADEAAKDASAQGLSGRA
jgi:ribonuclease HI